MECFMKNCGVTKKTKEVKLSDVKIKITFDDYVECLENLRKKTISQNLIRSNIFFSRPWKNKLDHNRDDDNLESQTGNIYYVTLLLFLQLFHSNHFLFTHFLLI